MLQLKKGDQILNEEGKDLFNPENFSVIFQPVVEVGTNQVFGYKTLICNSDSEPVTNITNWNGLSARDLNELTIRYLNIQIQKAQEMGLDRVFIDIEPDMLKEIESICIPPNMEMVLEIPDLQLLGVLQTCQETFEKWWSQGFQFAIDDFGAGFKSLPIIARLMPEYIKIDLPGMMQDVAWEELKVASRDLLEVLRHYSKKGIFYTP